MISRMFLFYVSPNNEMKVAVNHPAVKLLLWIVGGDLAVSIWRESI